MNTYLLIAAVALLVIVLIVLALVLIRSQGDNKTLSQEMRALTDKNYEQQIMLMETLSSSADKQSAALSQAITSLRESNEKKLDEMRVTVDEKLSETLNKRINASFGTVSEQLGNVYRSLGEMMKLSGDLTENVSGLNRVLTNVKSRGTWAEVQLGNILESVIPNMYERNVRTNPLYNGRVEFAVKIPSADGEVTYLPIDSKFPMEDYARLCSAAEAGDYEAAEQARKALEATVKNEARMIKQYISVPETTPFAIMYLATEGLYAEIMISKNALPEQLQAQGIMLAGPSTVTALLNSLSMGFKSFAINRKASEVFKVLGAAKAQYDKFGEQLDLVRKRLEAAGSALDEADKRNEIIKKRLRDVEAIDIVSS